jgi:hypothetical protein
MGSCSSKTGLLLGQHLATRLQEPALQQHQQLVLQAQQLQLLGLQVVAMASAALWLRCAVGCALMATSP